MVIKMEKVRLFFIAVMIFYGCTTESVTEITKNIPNVPDENEIVMIEGMKITAATFNGTITITAEKGLKRSYTWEGATRSVIMGPRKVRWFGSMGIYYPGPGNHWTEHNGISRGVVQEGQQHFATSEDALVWLKSPSRRDCIYRNDGLVVCYSKNLPRRQINVDVWQIYIGGKTVSKYQEYYQDKDGYYKEWDKRFDKIYYVGGKKPKRISGSQDEKIKIEFSSVDKIH